MKVNILFAVLVLSLLACNDKPKENNHVPKAFEQKTLVEDISISRKYSSNAVEELYREALEKDTELKKLQESFNEQNALLNESLKDWHTFKQNNEAYMTHVKSYLGQIQDTILKKRYENYFDGREQQWINETKAYVKLESELTSNRVKLADLNICLKLLASNKLMEEYRQEEKPDLNKMKDFFNQQKELIDKTNKKLEEIQLD